MVKIYLYTTILTNSVRKGNTFFRNHKRLHPKKTQNMLQNINKKSARPESSTLIYSAIGEGILLQEVLVAVLDDDTTVRSIYLATYNIVHRSVEIETSSSLDILYRSTTNLGA